VTATDTMRHPLPLREGGRGVRSFLPQIAVLLAAALFTAMFFYTALSRMSYRYDLDFDEDSILMQSLWVAQGLPVYVAPNADFNPHVYMPLFFWLGGLLIKLGGPSLPLLRILPLAATLAATGLIYWIARRESGRRWVALACAGLFLGGYRINGFWYDVIRVDSLFVALMVGGLAVGIYAGRSRPRLVLSAALLALAFLTKQTGLFIGAGLAGYLLLAGGRRALWFIVPFLLLALAPIFILNSLTGGWFFYHVFTIGSADPIEIGRGVNFVVFDLFGVMAALTLAAIAAALREARHAGWRFWLWQPWLLAIVLAIAISGLGRVRVGGNLNNRMPAYALLCLAPALLARQGLPGWRQWALGGAVLAQFALGVYNPPRYIPTAEMRAAGDRLIQRIAAEPGPVLVMMHPYYALLAGQTPATQIATLWYVRHRGEQPLPDDFVSRLSSRYYTAIISDESVFETDPAVHLLLLENYSPAETLDTNQAPATNTGVVVRPQLVYRPRILP
jgi:hypothetical protein